FERLLMSHPLKPLNDSDEVFPEAAVRRVWSIDGDFSLMLSTIPCAASLCEFNGGRIELLRINEEYLVMTGDQTERLYTEGTNVRALTTEEDYRQLQGMLQEACDTRGFAEGLYNRYDEHGNLKRYKVKIKFLTGDEARSLFFITYWPISHGQEGNPQSEPVDVPEGDVSGAENVEGKPDGKE
ncbi:MAG: hypothetical protein PHY64_12990, partial [Eubacteriales bacterium]|nr:hypothetical protein [Eubacteriales bacterium]